jgi:ABC-type dipeptide/oligopeptide/nickel transport system permease component
MPSIFRFLLNRLFSILLTLWLLSMLLYGIFMLTPPEVRATLYYSSGVNLDLMSDLEIKRLNDQIIKRQHLDGSFIIQYTSWVQNLLKGDWGWSPVRRVNVLPILLRRALVTSELAFYSLIIFIPMGLISGLRAGVNWKSRMDTQFRITAFIATAIPPFIMALVLMSIFYIGTHWFPPQRLGIQGTLYIHSDAFRQFTGFLTIDGFLNKRPDISLEALRHLVLPALTVCLGYWGLIGRVTRASVIEEQFKDYFLAAQARGLSTSIITWNYLFRNALTPALTSTMLSAASIFTSIFIVEVIFDFKGISSLVLDFSLPAPDASLLLGFSLFSVIAVLLLTLILDLIIAALDPRIREGVMDS